MMDTYVGLCYFMFSLYRICVSATGDDVLRYSVTENNRAGYPIANLIPDAGLDRRYSAGDLERLQFRFLQEHNVNISVRENDGLIYTTGRVDRDILCPRQELCRLSLDVEVRPANYFQIIKVLVEIVDVNDNVPTFPESNFTLNILESAAPGSSFQLPTAVDNDSPRFGVQRYELVRKVNRFLLDVATNLDGSMIVRLVLRRKLDRESVDSYSLTVVATDGGARAQTGFLNVFVRVLDSNDHEPVFDQDVYEVTIREHISENSVITRVHASDMDVGMNGEVRYRLSPRTDENYGHLFGIDSESGEIYVRGTIDREKSAVYNLIVTARDLGPESTPSDVMVVVHVEDINDNPPVITVNTLLSTDTDRAHISEDASNNTFVAHISVDDPDSGINGRFSCSLNDDSFYLEERYGKDYHLRTYKPLDREETATYSLAIVCTDEGDDEQVSVKHLQVVVTDVNDNRPVFSQNHYSATVTENNEANQVLLRVNASDEDISDNGQIVYEIDPTVMSFFDIHQDGRIIVKKSIDRESNPGFHFTVKATDRGTPALTGSARVTVTVTDVNDEIPRFKNQSYHFFVKEGREGGALVGAVNATDRDNPPFNSIRYTLQHGIGYQEAFVIDHNSGAITTTKALDREEQASYDLVAVAADSHNALLTSTARILVTITDVNDNRPEFTFPSLRNKTIHISSKVPVGHIIARISARDRDADNNSRLIYLIKNTVIENIFSLDRDGGTLRLNADQSGVDYKKYNISLIVRDHGRPPLSDNATITIIVNKSIPLSYSGVSSRSILNKQHVFIMITAAAVLLLILVAISLVACLIRRKKRTITKNDKIYRMQVLLNGEENTTPTKLPSIPYNGSNHSSVPSKNPSPSKESHYSPGIVQPSMVYYSGAMRQVLTNHDPDQYSANSTDDSITDSGRGASEEGEAPLYARAGHRYGQLPQSAQPIISGVRPLPPCPPPPPARALTSNYGYATTRNARPETGAPKQKTAGTLSRIEPLEGSPNNTAKVTWGAISTAQSPGYCETDIDSSENHICVNAKTLPTKSALKKMESLIV